MPDNEKRASAKARPEADSPAGVINTSHSSTPLSAAPTPVSQLPPTEQARQQLSALFLHGFDVGEWIEIRCLDCSRTPARPGPRGFFRSVADAVDFAMEYKHDFDVFAGVGLRRCPTTNRIADCPHPEMGKDHVSRLSAAWGDFDATATDDGPADVAARLRGGGNAPPMLVQSGRGLHGYWPMDPTPDLDGVERLNRRIRDSLGGDNVIDAGRVLRVAGTLNYKYGEPLPVLLLSVTL